MSTHSILAISLCAMAACHAQSLTVFAPDIDEYSAKEFTLAEFEARPFFYPATIKNMPLAYDNPGTPEIESISVWQTPAYKLVENGKELWFRDHYIAPAIPYAENDSRRLAFTDPSPYNSDEELGKYLLRALYSVTDRCGIKREDASKEAYVDTMWYNRRCSFRYSVTLSKKYGSKKYPVVFSDGGPILPPTRVPASPPQDIIPPEYKGDPFNFHGITRDTDYYDREDVGMTTELVDVGKHWDIPDTPGVECLRIWRGYDDRIGTRDWFLLSEEDLKRNKNDPFTAEGFDYGEEPWDLPIEKAIQLAAYDLKLAFVDEEMARIREQRKVDPEYKRGEEPKVEKYRSLHNFTTAELVRRTYKGKTITFWFVNRAWINNDREGSRFVLLNGNVIRPTKVDKEYVTEQYFVQHTGEFRMKEEDRRRKVMEGWFETLRKMGIPSESYRR